MTQDDILKILKTFPWWDYGLDVVDEADDEWARDLAAIIFQKVS